MGSSSGVERSGSEKIGKLLWEFSSQATFLLLVYAIYSLTNVYFLSVGINSLAAAAASIIFPVLLLAFRLFPLTGIWASEAVSELILWFISLAMLNNFQTRTIAQWRVKQAH